MDKLLTVVIPTFNMEKYLRRCLDSLIIEDKELFDKLEVLVINDGSKDNSLAIAKDYKLKYPDTFRVIDKENGNYGSCVNRGLKEAKGTYFRLLDADDYIVKGAMASFLLKLSSGIVEVDVVYTPYQINYIQKDKVVIYRANDLKCDEIINLNKVKLPDLNYLNYTMHALTYRTNHLREIGFRQQEGISYTDTEYVYYPLVLAKTFISLDLILYNYVVGIEGQTVSVSSMKRNEDSYWKLYNRFIMDNTYRKGNISAYQIRQNILTVIIRPIIDLYIKYDKYDIENEKKIRKILYHLKNYEESIYNHIMSFRRKKIFYPYKLWLLNGKLYFLLKWSLFKN